MGRSSVSVGVASIVGSFVVYAACGGVVGRGVAQVPTGTSASVATGIAPSTSVTSPTTDQGAQQGACGCAAPKVVASFALTPAAGEEKITLDPLDATTRLDVEYVRGPQKNKLAALTAVVRAYRSDVAAERPTTLSIRVLVPENGGAATTKDVEAFITTWGADTKLPPRALATVAKSSLTATLGNDAIELRGSLVLKDVATGKSLLVDKLSIKKTGTSLLPPRTGAFVAP